MWQSPRSHLNSWALEALWPALFSRTFLLFADTRHCLNSKLSRYNPQTSKEPCYKFWKTAVICADAKVIFVSHLTPWEVLLLLMNQWLNSIRPTLSIICITSVIFLASENVGASDKNSFVHSCAQKSPELQSKHITVQWWVTKFHHGISGILA